MHVFANNYLTNYTNSSPIFLLTVKDSLSCIMIKVRILFQENNPNISKHAYWFVSNTTDHIRMLFIFSNISSYNTDKR